MKLFAQAALFAAVLTIPAIGKAQVRENSLCADTAANNCRYDWEQMGYASYEQCYTESYDACDRGNPLPGDGPNCDSLGCFFPRQS